MKFFNAYVRLLLLPLFFLFVDVLDTIYLVLYHDYHLLSIVSHVRMLSAVDMIIVENSVFL